MTNRFIIRLADNGYIVETPDNKALSVYEGEELPCELTRHICCDLDYLIDTVAASQYSVTINVEPIVDKLLQKPKMKFKEGDVIKSIHGYHDIVVNEILKNADGSYGYQCYECTDPDGATFFINQRNEAEWSLQKDNGA